MEDKKKQSMLKEMLEGRGFYIVLLLCLLTVGATGLVMAKDGEKLEQVQTELERQTQVLAPSVVPQQEQPQQPLAQQSGNADDSGEEDVLEEEQPSAEPVDVPAEQQSVETMTQEAEQAAESAASQQEEEQPQAQSVMAQEKALSLRAPLPGAVQRVYSGETLQYDETMGDYRSHGGVDLSAEVGTPVMAAADGQVTGVYTDDRLGQVVVLDHGNGLQTLYGNLGEVSVVAGDVLQAGDVLAATGESAAAEQAQQPHLHLEVIRSGLREDPAQYIMFAE